MSLCILLFLLTGVALAEKKQLTIAVAAEDTEITSRICKVAARAPYFLFFDNQDNLLQTVKNPYVYTSGSAGPKAAGFLIEKKVDLIIAGRFGHKMQNALKPNKVQMVEQQGRVIDAVKEQNHGQ